ncbi:hypothetical protein K4A83_13180 [Spirulina subsalsa FACHB-351]|uniref:Thioredoxin domain-containing protein n=1 Tax=Spirulina subsalsa FACHB-351 TaxID=234711 RepID=A0ABT3L6U6_9CYAN|nr:thioredoxin domain-containing protein [Spirulina subsalsa]MCW6037215.1 hypothetical protein [Spirulina subsalsa FACHB-351]
MSQSNVKPEEQKAINPSQVTFSLEETRHVGGYALRRLFHESDRLLVVKYMAAHCSPCRTLKPILDAVVNEFEGKIHFVEIDVDVDPEIADDAQIVGTPIVQFFQDKEMLVELRGVKQKSEYRQIIEDLC